MAGNPHIAILVPCYNEELTIPAVITGFRAVLPEATIYVYDNRSTDRTADVARESGAIVGYEPLAGKGNVIRRMFGDIEADIYVMVDGDDTYDSSDCPAMIRKLLAEDLDMVCGARQAPEGQGYRPGHRFGNRMFTSLVGFVFGRRFEDLLTGYRVFSRRFVKSFPALSQGFEIETELTVHSLELRMKTAEVGIRYGERPEGSVSKLSTMRDGLRILWTVFNLMRAERPLIFFGALAALLAVVALIVGIPVVLEFLQTGLVPRFPSAILAASLMVLGFLMLTAGLILDSVLLARRELKRLHYLGCSRYIQHSKPPTS